MINNLLDKEYGKNVIPNGENDESVANNLKDFFDSKVWPGLLCSFSGLFVVVRWSVGLVLV